tara:strand:- start:946 stop:1470 length:525 start_codon:yes stop_codon:yes gene_type:complete
MNLEGIIAISGKPGLFKIIGQTKNGVVVESLLNANRLAMSSSSKMSALQDIAIYTYTEEIPLVEVLDMIRVKESGKISIGHKSSKDVLISYFNEVLKNFDEDRVYVSDIKKVISWYNTLQKSGFAVASDPSKTDDAIEENDVKKAVSKVKITPKSTSNSKAKSSAKKKSKKKDK